MAVSVAYLIGMITAFLLARALVFEAIRQPWQSELTKFTTVNIVSFAQVWLVSVGLVRFLLPQLAFHWRPLAAAAYSSTPKKPIA